MMKRSFFSVGQGAFYVERFFDMNNEYGRTINIIYDCGSATDRTIVENKIKEQFPKNEIIDAVFISHFDDDHINGLPFLLKHCHVKNLFFPFLTNRGIIYHQLSSLIADRENSVVFNFLRNPYSFINQLGLESNPRLYQVYPNDQDNTNRSDDNNGFNTGGTNSGENTTHIILDENKPYESKLFKNWELIPFNFRCFSKEEQFESALKSNLHIDNIPQGESLVELYREHKKEIKKTFKEIPGSNNTNSMTLFSGVRDGNYRQIINNLYRYRNQFTPDFSFAVYLMECKKMCGCLYMGDYDASSSQKWNSIKNAYGSYWDYIGCVQIPHHGAKDSFNAELSKINAYAIISAGVSNRYHHPSPSVVKSLISNHSDLYLVTEIPQSQVDFVCDF